MYFLNRYFDIDHHKYDSIIFSNTSYQVKNLVMMSNMVEEEYRTALRVHRAEEEVYRREGTTHSANTS